MHWTSQSPQETFEIAQKIINFSSSPWSFLLEGDLGAGKTQLSKGFGKYFGVPVEEIQSPTFAYLSVYEGKHPETYEIVQFFHFDLYRLEREHEADDMIVQYQEMFQGNCVVVEWSERLSEGLRSRLLSHGFKRVQCIEVSEKIREFILL